MPSKDQIKRWFRQFKPWIAEPKILWITAVVLAFTILAIFSGERTEPKIRWAGLILQFLGMMSVIFGIRQTRIFFRKPSLFFQLIDWIRRRPRLNPQFVTASINAGSSPFIGQASAYTWYPRKIGGGLEFRLDSIERNLEMVREMTLDLRDEFNRSTESLKSDLRLEASDRQNSIAIVNQRIEDDSMNGLHMSLMGVIWLIVGVFFSTASPEIFKIIE